VLGTSFAKFNPAPDTLTVGNGMDNMDNHIVAFHMEWCISMGATNREEPPLPNQHNVFAASRGSLGNGPVIP